MKTYYTIYQITNLVNGKIYIGSHKTRDLDDNYMGSGKYLRHSINKHGVENFCKEILFVFETPEEMYAKEAELVDVNFIAEENTYNLKVGGFGGWDYVNSDAFDNPTHSVKHMTMMSKCPNNTKFTGKTHAQAYRDEISRRMKGNAYFGGKTHSRATKKILSELKKGTCIGKDNSQYGTCWIHDITVEQNKKIKKVDLQAYLDKGWVAGRKMKF